MMKTMSKVIAAMMIVALTNAMPAMAGNKKHHHDKNTKVVVVVDHNRRAPHVGRMDKRPMPVVGHLPVYRPDVKMCTFRVSRFDSHRKAVARAERLRGVMDTKWNPRTRELTVIYDAKVTSARHIFNAV